MDLPEELARSPMAALLQQNGTEDPRTLLILNALQQATTQTSRDTELETLRARVDALTAVNASLRQGLRAVAAAIGACPRCLGDDDDCMACGGDGVPGMRRPDRDAFARYVIPAVRRARPQTASGASAAPPATEVSHGIR